MVRELFNTNVFLLVYRLKVMIVLILSRRFSFKLLMNSKFFQNTINIGSMLSASKWQVVVRLELGWVRKQLPIHHISFIDGRAVANFN